MNRKKVILIMVLCDLILICYFCANTVLNQDKASTTTMQFCGVKDQYNQLLVNTYLTKIIRASDQFYDEYYTFSPTLNYYSVFVKKVSFNKRTYYVTFTSSPYIGPHDTIGIDEITFSADYLGNVKLEELNHLKSYHLPDNLKDLERKTFPEKYYKE